MTLCELLHQVAWDDICPHIERHLPERPETKLADYERLFELVRKTAPDRTTYIPRMPLTFRLRSPVNGTIWLMIRLTILVVTSPIMPSVARCRVRWPHGSKNSRYPSTNPSGPPFAFGSCCATMERMTTATRPK